jgi:murein DD-endopeptidase MepM/ murein hydrolase activator NlpD
LSIPLRAVGSLSATAKADDKATPQEIADFVNDPFMQESGLAVDIMGNPAAGGNVDYIKSHTFQSIVDRAISEGQIRKSGAIVRGSLYAQHVEDCNNPAKVQVDTVLFDEKAVQPTYCRDGSDQRNYFNALTTYRTLLMEEGTKTAGDDPVAPLPEGFTLHDGFGKRVPPCPGCSDWHVAQDFGPGAGGSEVMSILDGTVISIGSNANHVVRIQHADGLVSSYWHMYTKDIKVSVGSTVSAGEVIGKVGCSGQCTGDHLHFELEVSEVDDPSLYDAFDHNTAGPAPVGSRINPVQYFQSFGVPGF